MLLLLMFFLSVNMGYEQQEVQMIFRWEGSSISETAASSWCHCFAHLLVLFGATGSKAQTLTHTPLFSNLVAPYHGIF